MDAAHWGLAGLLALGLAASVGLNTFLPLLMLAVAAHFHLAGVTLNAELAWMGSDTALVVLALATALELIGDKVPAVDHALHAVGTVARPAAGWLIATSALGASVDPATAAIIGLMIGAPTAFGFHAAKSSTRALATGTTLGAINPFLSAFEDLLALALALLSFIAPLLVPIALGVIIIVFLRLTHAVRRRLAARPPWRAA